MASSLIHMCVAKEVNKKLHRDMRKFYIGSIAPDIAKQIGETKTKSHFITGDDNIPNIELFLSKYKKDCDDDFVLGYFVHLYTDYLWAKNFLPNFITKDYVYTLDGEKVRLRDEEKVTYLYNDYTNINIQLVDAYQLELNIFYEEQPVIPEIIKEIPMDQLQIIIDKAGIILENTKIKKAYLFDIEIIQRFIEFATDACLSMIEERLNEEIL